MLEGSKAYSGFAVDDLDKALKFYGDTLGLKTSVRQEGVLGQIDLAGDRPTLFYVKPDFTPATYTILNFPVDDVEAAVDELTANGVSFERYDGFDQDERASTATGRTAGSPGSRTPPATSWPCTGS